MKVKKKRPVKTNKPPVYQAMVHVGGPLKESVAEARAAINDILASPSDTAAKVAALQTLGKLCDTSGSTNITGCTFTGGK